MIVITAPENYSHKSLDPSQQCSLAECSTPLVLESEILLFKPDSSKDIYIIENLEDITSIQADLVSHKLAGEWQISSDEKLSKIINTIHNTAETESLLNPHPQNQGPNSTVFLTYPHIIKEVLLCGLPIAGNQLIDALGNFSSSLILARINSDTLAASLFINASQLSTVVVFSSVLNSVSNMVSEVYVSNNKSDIGNIMQQSWVLGLICSIPPMLILANINRLLIVLGQPANFANIVQSYFNPYIWGIPASMWLYSDMQFAYAIKKSHIAVMVNLAGALISSGVSYVLAYGKFGAPELKASGVGFGWLIQAWASLILFKLALFYYRRELNELGLVNIYREQKWNTFSKLFRIGLPIAVQTGGDLFSFFVTAIIIGRLPRQPLSLSAFEIASQILLLGAIPLYGISQANCLLVSRAYGMHTYSDMKKFGYLGMIVGIGLMSVFCLGLSLFPKLLASIYIDVNNPNNSELLTCLRYLFIFIGMGQIFNAIRETAGNALRGLSDTAIPMVYRLMTTWGISILFGYLSVALLDGGIYDIALISNIGTAVCAGALLLRWWNKSEEVANNALINSNNNTNSLSNSCGNIFSNCYTFFNNPVNSNSCFTSNSVQEKCGSIWRFFSTTNRKPPDERTMESTESSDISNNYS